MWTRSPCLAKTRTSAQADNRSRRGGLLSVQHNPADPPLTPSGDHRVREAVRAGDGDRSGRPEPQVGVPIEEEGDRAAGVG